MRIFRGLINISPEEESEEVQLVCLEKRRWRGYVSSFLAPVSCCYKENTNKQLSKTMLTGKNCGLKMKHLLLHNIHKIT